MWTVQGLECCCVYLLFPVHLARPAKLSLQWRLTELEGPGKSDSGLPGDVGEATSASGGTSVRSEARVRLEGLRELVCLECARFLGGIA